MKKRTEFRSCLHAVILILCVAAIVQGRAQVAPHRQDVVASVAQQYPAEWANAHHDGPAGDDFIRRLAWVLHSTVDQRFGLNGKCGTDNISLDVVAFLAPTQIEAYDVIEAAGGPNARPAWTNITDPNGCGSKWIKPTDPGGTVPPPPPPPPDCAQCNQALGLANGEIAKLRDELALKDRHVGEIEGENEQLRAQHQRDWERVSELEAKVRELEQANPPVGCNVTGGPGWIRSMFGIRCELVRAK